MRVPMKDALHGMYWSCDLDLPPMRTVNSLREGLFVFRKNSAVLRDFYNTGNADAALRFLAEQGTETNRQ